MSTTLTQRNRDIEPLSDAIKRRNAKCKRAKCLYKKSYELSLLCNVDVNIQIYDRSINKITEFATNSDCTFKHLTEMTTTNHHLFSSKRFKTKSLTASEFFNHTDKVNFKPSFDETDSLSEDEDDEIEVMMH